MDTPSVFHEGEQEVQRRLGVRSIETWAQKVVRPAMPTQHREFYAALPFLVVAARDDDGRAWASILAGPPGFVRSPSATLLRIDTPPVAGDALEHALHPGRDLGILGIEFSTRRRNRVNGRVVDADPEGFSFAVDQSFGNCPQYIHEREWTRAEPKLPGAARRSTSLTEAQQTSIGRADTFFIASGYRGEGDDPRFGMDASHRGGDPGFVQVEGERRISFVDRAGNNHFNTIGNLLKDPRVGLLFVDFETGSMLQLSGRASVSFGAQRRVSIEIEHVVELREALPLRWQGDATAIRSLRLVEKTPESADVTSFVFTSRDGGRLPSFGAGQHLPIELRVEGLPPIKRTYSISSGPQTSTYRISVKREARGLASRLLHDALEPGALVSARSPAGDFVLHPANGPVVLISAGIGVTPMLSMLHALSAGPLERDVWFIHGARDGQHHPFRDEVETLAANRPKTRVHVAYSRPAEHDHGYDTRGRIDGSLLRRLALPLEADYFVCGPSGFMAEVFRELEAMGIDPRQLHSESFGPSTV